MISSVICVIAVSSGKSTTPFLLSAINAGGGLLAYIHIANFYSDKAKVPFTQNYNDGIRASQQMLPVLGGLSASWAFSTVIYLYWAIAD